MGTPPTSEARARSNSSRERACLRAKRSSSAAWTAARRPACVWVTDASLRPPDRVAQRLLEIGVAEDVAALERAPGHGALAVGDELGRAGVDRALPAGIVEGGEVEPDDVVGVDPGQVLAPTGDGPPDAEAEERQHLGQRAALLVERHAGSQHGHPQPVVGGAGGLALPRDAHAGQEVVAGTGVLGDGLVAAGAVVADGRRADQCRGAGFGAADPRDEVARADLARIDD